MKKFLKNWFINGVVLALISWLFTGIEVSYQPYDFFLAALAFTIIIKLMKPVFELVFLPINLLTLGIFRWVRTVISFGLLVYLVNGVKLKAFYFPGLKLAAIEIQSFKASQFVSLTIGALLLHFSKKIVRWILKTK